MKKLKKIIIVLCFSIILILCLVIVSNAGSRFYDLANSLWAENDICFCYYHGAFYTTSHYFNPEGGLRRDVAVDGIRRMLDIPGIPKHANTEFSDVPYSNDYSGSIKWAYDNNITRGTGENEFSPATIITKQEFATLVYRACLVEGVNLPNTHGTVIFNDDSLIASWARPAITALSQSGLILGYPNGNFGPTDTINRASGASMLSRLYALNKYPGNELIFYVRDINGAPIPDATVYGYYTNENTAYDKYPETNITTNSYGIAILNSTNNSPIAANVFAYSYKQGITDQKFYRSNFINTVELTQHTGTRYSIPISGFNNMSEWTTTRRYVDSCQNYGWRYGGNNQSEFHQGIDIGRTLGTSVYSSSAGRVYRAGYYGACGLLVQIETCFYNDQYVPENNKYYYFIYQHLNSKNVAYNDQVTQGQVIGTVGNSGGNYGYHLHYSISYKPEYDLDSRSYIDPFMLLQNQTSYYN